MTTKTNSNDFLALNFADYDLVLLDIILNEHLNGIDVAKKTRTCNSNVPIMFITKTAQFAVDSYDVDAIDYILKPLSYFEFALKIKKAIRRIYKEAEDLLNQLDNDISAYNEIIVTDNQVLNIILQEKWYYCKKHDIKLTMNVNPNAFSQVTNTDMYTLVGHIIDNAIEAVMQIQDKEKRIISIDITVKKGLSTIVCNNYFQGEIQYDKENKTFITHKSDKISHGLGIKSIELLARKYDGISKINIDDNVFTITVSIPN